jgi:hypothetical protein
MGMVEVRRFDLEYLLAHVADEMNGHPDPAHWRLPLLTQALERLQQAVKGTGPVIIRTRAGSTELLAEATDYGEQA